MKTPVVALILVVLAAAVVGYGIGYKSGPARKHQRSDAEFRIAMGERLYGFMVEGETNRAIGQVRFLLWNDTVAYEQQFGVPSGSDSFARSFAAAKDITASVEAELRSNAQWFEGEVDALIASNHVQLDYK